ncbi:glycine-rich domain-containing protein, partial [Polynucleobacter nymphae]|uniref:glycine-rich domain-containing protein n=1 Tax=Polynucleobacter nymphae TaxID=2081043 RepID=UPI001C0D3B68
MTITGNAIFGGAITNVTNLSVSGTTSIAADITTTGTQLYSGAVTLSGGDRTLTGTTITTNGITGGSNGLTITGAGVFNGAVTGITNLSVSSTSTLAANVSTTGTQLYSGEVTIGGSLVTLTSTGTGSNGNISFSSAVDGNADNTQALTVVSSGTMTFGAAVGVAHPLSALTTGVGTTSLAGNITTSGGQTYGGNVVLNNSLNLSSLTNGDITIAGNLSAAQAILQLLGNGAYILNGTTYTPSGTYTTALGNVGSLTWTGTNYTWTPLTGASTSELLLVGGGGAAGSQYGGGGGGGGGLIYKTDVTLSAGVAYTIGIGNGGIAVASDNGGNGGSTSISGTGLSLTAIGGGGGSTYNKLALNTGGSGGGTRTDPAQCGNAAPCPGATSVYYSDGLSYTYGNPGGSGGQNGNGVGGGGGGAGASGGNASNKTGGNGGNGLTVSITGQSQTFAGGGGGGAENVSSGSAQGVGGTGGGGTAVISPLTAQNGQANTGGGGGALGGCISAPSGCNIYQKAGDGGSGIAVVRYSVVGLNVSTGSGKFILTGNSSTLASLNISSTSTTNAINGIVGGSTTVTVGGSGGVFTLSGANTYTGGTTVSAGTLQAGASSTPTSGTVTSGPFGTGRVTVNSGATLDLNGKTIANLLTLNGTGDSSNGALYNSSSSAATANGAITLGSSTTIKNVGALTLGSTINGAFGLTITTTSTGAVTLGGAIGGTTNLSSLTTNASSGSAGITISGGSIITTGAINFGHAITLSTATTTTFNAGTAVSLGSTLNGGGNALTISNNAEINGALTSVSTLQVGGTTSLGANVTTTVNQSYTGAVTLIGADRTLTSSGGGSVALGATDGLFGLTVSNGAGSITLGAIGINSPLTYLTLQGTGSNTLNGNITSSGSVDLKGTSRASTFSADRTISTSSGNGNVTFGVVNSAFGLNVAAGSGTISTLAVGTTTPLAFITFTGSGINTIGGYITSAGAINLGTLRTSNVASSQTISSGSTLNIGAVNLSAAVNLTLDAGTNAANSITVASITGPATGTAANVTFSSGGAVTVSGDITTGIGTLWLNKTAGNVSFAGSLQVSQFKTDANSTYNISLTGSTNSIASFATATPFETSGTLTIGDSASDTFTYSGGSFVPSSPSSLSLGGTITTSSITAGAGYITLGDSNTSLALNSNLTLNSSASNGTITIARAIAGAGKDLTLNAGTGTISITAALTGMGGLSLSGNKIDWSSTLDGTGVLTLKPTTTTNLIHVNGTTDATSTILDVTATEIANLGSNFTGLVFGGASQSGDVYLKTNLASALPVTLRTSGVIYLQGDFTGSGSSTLNLTGATQISAARTLSATTVTTNSTLTTVSSGAYALTITGNAVFGGAITAVTNLSVSGTSSIAANITTTGTQGYTGAVTLTGTGATRTLQGTTITTSSTIAGGANSLTITGNAVLNGAVTGVTNLSVSGTTSLGADISTSGTQTYTGAVTISGGDRVLTATNNAILFSSTINSDAALTPRSLTILAGSGNTTFSGAVGNTYALNSLRVDGTSTIAANITTAGTQNFVGNVVISGTDVNLSSTGNSGSGQAMNFGADIDGLSASANSLYLYSGIAEIAVGGNIGKTVALNYLGLGGTGTLTTISGTTTNNYDYTGAAQTFTATYAGTYTFYLWGAKGGAYGNGYPAIGGNGGYATGSLDLTAGQTINIYVGGAGTLIYNGTLGGGGWNGGGNGQGASGGGGGATDIRVGGTALTNRVIVAGGGGGGGLYSYDGGYGGGLTGGTGGNATNSTAAYGGTGGTQSAGGTGSGTYLGSAGTLGQGGQGGRNTGTADYAGGGGGGYYGGAGGAASVNYGSGYGGSGGGGSSYIGGVSSATTIAGNASMPATGGGTQIGQAGNGYARIVLTNQTITTFSAGTQTGKIQVNGSVKATTLNTANTAFELVLGLANNNSTIGSATTFNNTGALTIGSTGSGQTLTISGALIATASSVVKIGTSITTAGNQTYGAAQTQSSGLTIDSTSSSNNGVIAFNSTLDSIASGSYGLTVSSGSGNVTFTGIVGGASGGALGALTVNSTGATTFSAAVT